MVRRATTRSEITSILIYNKPISVGNPYENIPSLQVNSLPNPHLQWELTKKLQFGVDLGFLKDRILVTANYAINRSSNELLQYSLPLITGFNSITSNFPATVQNSDWEISLNTINVKGKQFTWSSRINLTVPKNKLVAFPQSGVHRAMRRSCWLGSLLVLSRY